MADEKVWTGSASEDFGTAGNWTPNGIPADGDHLIFGDQAVKACTGSMTQAAKAFSLTATKGFTYYIGASGTPLVPANGFTFVEWSGRGTTPSYLDVAATDYDHVIVDSTSSINDTLVLDGDIVRRTLKSGKMSLNAAATISGRVNVMGGGQTQSHLTIPAGVTTTGAVIAVDGGNLALNAAVETLLVDGGEVVIDGTATNVSTRLEVTGGRVYWDAGTSTLTLVEMRGGEIQTRKSGTGWTVTASRIVTAMHMYGDATVDFRVGGDEMTFSNGIRVYGNKLPIMPKGMQYDFTR